MISWSCKTFAVMTSGTSTVECAVIMPWKRHIQLHVHITINIYFYTRYAQKMFFFSYLIIQTHTFFSFVTHVYGPVSLQLCMALWTTAVYGPVSFSCVWPYTFRANLQKLYVSEASDCSHCNEKKTWSTCFKQVKHHQPKSVNCHITTKCYKN